jgi:hypothetical protein
MSWLTDLLANHVEFIGVYMYHLPSYKGHLLLILLSIDVFSAIFAIDNYYFSLMETECACCEVNLNSLLTLA